MKPGAVRVLRALFFVYAAFTFLHIAYVVYHEPFVFDAWNIANDTGAEPASVKRFFAFWHQQYTSSNPRIGQPMAYLAYKIVGVAELGTPLAFFGILIAGFGFGTGRLPKLSNNRDLATLAIGIGCMWFVAPNFPAYLFCRAYATNYMWLAAIQLWFLIPLRLMDARKPTTVSPGKLVAYFLLGVVAGMGNEHVGPTMIALVIGYGAWIWRKHRTRPPLLWVGAAGLVVGYALIFFAPGQGSRYTGFTERTTITQQILSRGLRGNAEIFGDLVTAAGPLLALIVCVIGIGIAGERHADTELSAIRDRQRRAMVMLLIAVIAASLITATVFASPLLGPRFYFHAMLIVLAGTLGVIVAFLGRARSFAPFVIVAVLTSGFAAARTMPMFRRLAAASQDRLAQLAATPVGSDGTATAWEQVNEGWWFLGDDLRDDKKQDLVARYFGLRKLVYRGNDASNLLGVTDAKVTLHYEFDSPLCLDKLDKLDIQRWIGSDIKALHNQLSRLVADSSRYGSLKWIDVSLGFVGTPPPMPRDKLFIARWRDGKLEGYTAKLKRSGRSKRREIVIDPELKKSPWDLYHVIVGEPPRLLGNSTDAKPPSYVPSHAGQYWTLACKDDYCFILLAVTHTL
jgi:hypothetical protein